MKYQIDGKEYPVEIIRKKNKHTYIRFKNGTIEVCTHYLVTKKQILDILDHNQDSIFKMITKCQQKQEKEEKFVYLGKSYDIIIIPTNDVEMIHNYVYTSSQKQLQKWYLHEAQQIFMSRYQICYQKFEEKIPYYPIRIRKMKTRWGVCNRGSKTITLNSELLRYPIEAIDYVIIHELSHLVHFNHSKQFWNLVAKYCPDYKKLKKQLKE